MSSYISAANIGKTSIFRLSVLVITVAATLFATTQVWAQLQTEGDALITVAGEAGIKPTPAAAYDDAATAYEVKYTSTDLPTLQEALPFAILQPTYLPDGLVLSDVRQITSSSDGERGAELIYRSPAGGWLSITQNLPLQPLRITVPDSQILHRVDINGQSGLIYDPGGPAYWERRGILVWHEGRRWFEMRSNFTYEELIDVARSLSP